MLPRAIGMPMQQLTLSCATSPPPKHTPVLALAHSEHARATTHTLLRTHPLSASGVLLTRAASALAAPAPGPARPASAHNSLAQHAIVFLLAEGCAAVRRGQGSGPGCSSPPVGASNKHLRWGRLRGSMRACCSTSRARWRHMLCSIMCAPASRVLLHPSPQVFWALRCVGPHMCIWAHKGARACLLACP